MACSKFSKKMDDFFENAPDIVIDKIIVRLPIRMAAQTSVLSKQWRRGWLSLEHLIFDSDFMEQQKNEDGSCNWQKSSRIISSILLHHNGPVHGFDLYVPEDADEDHIYHMNLSQWISFLSKNGIQMIKISHWDIGVYIPSNIFSCSELMYLSLDQGTLNPPPTCFNGFSKLKHLELLNVEFTKQNIFSSLIENCRLLTKLILLDWLGMDHIVIDAPRLHTLVLIGNFESLEFRNVCSLESISIGLRKMPGSLTVETAAALNRLASSCQLHWINFDGEFCKLFAASGILRSSSVTFNHVQELGLTDLRLSEFGALRDVLSMIESSPYIQKLVISLNSDKKGKNVGQHNVDCNYNYKLDNLQEVRILGIIGSSAELKLVEYVLAISPVLENMLFISGELGIKSERKMSRVLMGFPKASPKARLLFTER